ncbi:MAG: ATP synthase F1 subunit epsilon [Acidobacteria bacterium]|nr:ATP synthase F1 subunit epsilon [Acidobacteriota bacterium]
MGEEGTIRLKILTPDASCLEEEVSGVMVPGEEGYFGVLPGHIPLFSRVKPGRLTYWMGKSIRHFAVGGGYAEVLPNAVTIFVDVAEPGERIDRKRAELELHRAEEILLREKDEEKRRRAEYSRAKALARLEVAKLVKGG